MGENLKRPLAETHPDLASEALFDATKVTYGSGKKVPWRGKCGHEWDATVSNRSMNKSGCPYCAGRRVLVGFNDLATTHPEIASEACFDPTTIVAHHNSLKEWMCQRGHTWKARPATRTSMNSGCPVCSNRKILIGFNDLATTHPQLAQEALFDATSVTAHSGRKLSWKCANGHEWEAQVASRAYGRGCPWCYRRSSDDVISFARENGLGTNDVPLSVSHPELSLEAHGWNPNEISASHKGELTWQCPKDPLHLWSAKLSNRLAGGNCHVCASKIVLPGINDLTTTHPDIAKAMRNGDPTTVSAGSSKVFEWQCPKSDSHTWTARVASQRNGLACPICRGLQVVPGVNDLASTHPEIAVQAFEWDPRTVTAGSAKRRKWLCPSCQSTWETPISSRTNGRGCPVCAGQKVAVGYNDLAHIYPTVAAQANGWDPQTVTPGSRAIKLWRCSKDSRHEWRATVKSVVKGGGCPVCSNHLVVPGINDFATTHPELAATAFGWDTSKYSYGSRKKVLWKCTEDPRHIWHMTINSRTSGQDCAICVGNQVMIGINDLATVNPELASQLLDLDPRTVAPFSGRIAKWQCEVDARHQWTARIADRSSGNGCPVCHGLKVIPGVNDLATVNPELAAQAIDVDPRTISGGSKKKVKWRCPDDETHTWTVSVSERARHGCPMCSTGFNPSLAGTLYLVRSENWLKYGISNTPVRRMSQHAKGFAQLGEILDQITLNDGWAIFNAEATIKKAIREQGFQTAAQLGFEFDGKTETVRVQDFPQVASIIDLATILGIADALTFTES